MHCVICRLGLIAYDEAYQLQTALVSRRLEGEISNTLLLLEHPPTITVGRFGKRENILASQAQLEEAGISLVFTDRGGDVTYHGPGQLVGYPIIDLRNSGENIRQYIYKLEEVIIRTLKDFSLEAYRDDSHPGVWINGEEIAAIGLRIKRWIAMHGFAINVSPKLEHFSLINPCGFPNRKATSISSILSREIPMEEVADRLVNHFSMVFDAEMIQASNIMARGDK